MAMPTETDLHLRMPFGKHRGKYLDDLPSSYLLWIAENFTSNDKICEAADRIWQWREKYNEHKED